MNDLADRLRDLADDDYVTAIRRLINHTEHPASLRTAQGKQDPTVGCTVAVRSRGADRYGVVVEVDGGYCHVVHMTPGGIKKARAQVAYSEHIGMPDYVEREVKRAGEGDADRVRSAASRRHRAYLACGAASTATATVKRVPVDWVSVPV